MHPWEASYPPECRWDVPIAEGTLPGFLDHVAARFGDGPALEYRGHVLSYAQVKALADRVAAGLMAQGIGRGDCIALYLPNTPWHPVCFFAALRTGARVVHLSALDAKREIAHKARDAGATLLVTTGFPPLVANAEWLMEEGAVPRALLAPEARWGGEDAQNGFAALPEDDPPASWPAIAPSDVALLQYTGGTTGIPKGAMLTHGNLTAAVAIYKAWRDRTSIPEGEGRVLVLLPLFHIFALTAVLLRQMAEGSLCHLRTRFDAAQAVADIESLRITTFSGVPTMWIGILNLPRVRPASFASLRQATSGGAPMPFEVQQKLEALVGRRIGGGWGMTETCPAGTRLPPDAPRRAGLIGLPLPGVALRIVDPDEPTRERPVGEVGEIAVRGPNVFSGYWNREAENRAAFADGWFLTGDMGWMDERGFFTLVDRRKNMILSGGFNVYPAQIEQAIYEHPDVAECIVIGVPDDYRGQAAKAFVALKPGARGFTLDELRAFLADRLGRHELPAALEIRDTLPKSAAGKLLASALKAEFQGASCEMDLRYTADEIAFRDELRAFFRREIPAEIRRKVSEGRKLSREDIVTSQRVLHAHGLSVPNWPVEWGGKDWTPVQRYIFSEEIQAAAVPQPLSFNVNMVGPVIATFGSEAQKQRFLPPTANLDIWWAQGFSEPGAGSDLASLKTTARREGDEFVVNGQKTWTTLGQYADWIFCLVRTDPAARKKQEGISFLLIDMKTPGITLRPIITIDGGHEVNEVFFDEVRVPAENLVGQLNKGWDYAKFLLSNERIGIARIGMTKERLARVKRLAQETPAGEGTVWDDPDFRRRLAWSEIELKALEITQMRVVAAQRTRAADKPDPSSSILKIKGSEIQQQATQMLMEVAGPYAMPRPDRDEDGANLPSVGPEWADAAAPLFFNYRKVSIYGGSNEIQQIIAKAFLGL